MLALWLIADSFLFICRLVVLDLLLLSSFGFGGALTTDSGHSQHVTLTMA